MEKLNFSFALGLVLLLSLLILTGCPNSSNTKKLTTEEKAQMDALQNDVLMKIDEIAKITGRLLNSELTPAGKFELTINEDRGETNGKVTPLDNEIAVGYYCVPPGICSSDPCEFANNQVPFTGRDSIRMKSLQKELVAQVDQIGKIIGSKLGMNLTPVGNFSITINGKGENREVDIEMEPIIVIGDGHGCYKDPPGTCCECPCP